MLGSVQAREAAKQRDTDRQDASQAQHWRNAMLRGIERQLENDKRYLLSDDESEAQTAARLVHFNTVREQQLRTANRTELLGSFALIEQRGRIEYVNSLPKEFTILRTPVE